MNRGAAVLALVVLCLCCGPARSQAADTIPPFDIVLANGQHFTKNDLKKHVPVMVVYFDPTCSHCQEFARNLAAQIDHFRAGRIVMATFVPLSGITDFAATYHLDKPWVILGTEGYTLVLQKYYQVREFPVIVLYNRQGKQIRLYRQKYPVISFLHDQLFK